MSKGFLTSCIRGGSDDMRPGWLLQFEFRRMLTVDRAEALRKLEAIASPEKQVEIAEKKRDE